MVAYAIALVVNFPDSKLQNKKIKTLGTNAMVMTVPLFSVGIFMGVISGSGMVEAMANTIARGIAIGTSSHAIGTSKALEMGQIAGAMSSLSIAAAGILTAILCPAAQNLLPI